MKYLIAVLLLLSACQQKQSKDKKYRLVIIEESYNLLLNKKEQETSERYFFAKSDEAAFDTATSAMYGLQVAQKVVTDAFEKKGDKNQSNYFVTKPISVIAYDDTDIDVSLKIKDSLKNVILENYNIQF